MLDLRELFSFNRRERNGIVVLCSIIFLLLLVQYSLPYWDKPEPTDYSEFKDEIAEWRAGIIEESEEGKKLQEVGKVMFPEATLTKLNKSLEENLSSGLDNKSRGFISRASINSDNKRQFFEFDPNGLEYEKWKLLGLRDWQIDIIYNFESKGGFFKTPEDLGKVYGIDSLWFAQAKPYIKIDQVKLNQRFAYKGPIIEINSADSALLTELRGIGPSYAKRIIKFREILGGYKSIEQLQEVYGMKPETYKAIKPYVKVDPNVVIKLNVNKADYKTLVKHPYINRNLANSLVKYRQKHGLYKRVEDIKGSDLVNDELYSKIAPYLSVE